MRYEKKHIVQASQEAVADFHSGAEGFKTLAPFFVPMKIHYAPDPLVEGSEMSFTMLLGPIPVRWTARIQNSSTDGFDDVQVKGPFASWVHEHRFNKIDEHTTEIHDHIEADMPRSLIKWVPAALMWLGLPILFQYRVSATRRALEAKDTI